MGEKKVKSLEGREARARFIRHLLDDITALERMLEQGMIEEGITRIGAEQEFCLVTDHWRPSNRAEEILEAVADPHFTTELAKYNLEINLDPFEWRKGCFAAMHEQLNTMLKKAAASAADQGARVLLTGILPTISKQELAFEYMTPNPRYWALNDRIREMRGRDFDLRLRGVDELLITHDSVLFEACNTSFQVHLQVSPSDFAASYNWAQAIAGPVLAVSTNSPLLLGRELWSETRVALFQQSIDTRSSSYALKDQRARVTFGESWAEGSIVQLYRNEISRYKIILSRDISESSLEMLDRGELPGLKALNLHNGTIYRWNRPCYGAAGETAHLRIECRYLPSGPTVEDEMANFVFWAGLMKGRPAEFDHMPGCMDFRDAKANFIKAARLGKESVLWWRDGFISVRDLVLGELLPVARMGLQASGILDRYTESMLDIIARRAEGQTGSQWLVRNYRTLRKSLKQDDALRALTRSVYENQHAGMPVHEWPSAEPRTDIRASARFVGHIMSTQLFTVNENDLAELATSVMRWNGIHHMPVDDEEGLLRGLLTWTHMKAFRENPDREAMVSDIMVKEVVTTTPDSTLEDALRLMKQHDIGCLPVIQQGQLVGIITRKDLDPAQ